MQLGLKKPKQTVLFRISVALGCSQFSSLSQMFSLQSCRFSPPHSSPALSSGSYYMVHRISFYESILQVMLTETDTSTCSAPALKALPLCSHRLCACCTGELGGKNLLQQDQGSPTLPLLDVSTHWASQTAVVLFHYTVLALLYLTWLNLYSPPTFSIRENTWCKFSTCSVEVPSG